MDILRILKESKESLLLEDLDVLLTEVETGDYDQMYINECKELISAYRVWFKDDKKFLILTSEIPELTKYLLENIKPEFMVNNFISAVLEYTNNKKINSIDRFDLECLLMELKKMYPGNDAQRMNNSIVNEIKSWKNGDSLQKEKKTKAQIIMNLSDLTGDSADLDPYKKLKDDLKLLRRNKNYKKDFKQYIQQCDFLDSTFIDTYYSVFYEWEINTIVSVIPLEESFLEKYFGALDHDKIARYQVFSEAFYMKHFAQLDSNIVLLKGKNSWRKKENRSKQLDVFLRLKGVKL